MSKTRVYHFHNGTGGGVLSVIKNLLRYSASEHLENHVIHAVNPCIVPAFKIERMEGAVSQQVFSYNARDNFYYTCTRLKKLLPDEKAVIVAHDWVELGMASNLGLQNPVIQFLHGAYDYYYKLAAKHEAAVDQFVVVAEQIKQSLQDVLPHRRQDIFYLHLPVPATKGTSERQAGNFNIIFVGRPEKAKGYHLLPEIENLLRKKYSNVQWHIVGATAKNNPVWHEGSRVKFYGVISNEAVQKLLQEMHLIVLPSSVEGMPVSLIEAMKAGVVPLANDIPGGIQELITNGTTGYKIANSVEAYVEKMGSLIENRNLLRRMQSEAASRANRLFDPVTNTKAFEERLEAIVANNRRRKKATKVYGSRLDLQWLPNIFTSKVRQHLS